MTSLKKEKYDVVVIGGGHNGLTAAITLARQKKKVVLLEKRESLGGIASADIIDGKPVQSGLVHDTSGIRHHVVKELNLENFGLSVLRSRPKIDVLGRNGEIVSLSSDVKETSSDLKRYSAKDAEAYNSYQNFIHKIRPFINGLMNESPPDLMKLGGGDIWTLFKKSIGLKRLGNEVMIELLKVAPMSVADFLNERFETEFFKAGLAGPALQHSFNGPWSSYTTLNLLLWECAALNQIVGGGPALIDALRKCALDSGVEVRTAEGAEKILLNDELEVIGVRTTVGSSLFTNNVASTCTPEVTFMELLAPNEIDYKTEYVVQNLRSRGTMAKINLLVEGNITLNGSEKVEFARTGNSLDEMEKAFDAVKYGEFSKEPVLDLQVLKNQNEDGLTLLSIMVHYVPYNLRAGWTEKAKGELFENVISVLGFYGADLKNKIKQKSLLTPEDLEQQYYLTHGHVYHGEHAVDQLLTRPFPSAMTYRTDINGLYLCGGGSHPGGGITCMPGYLGAKAILKRN